MHLQLADMAGVSHNACLGLALQALDKLPTIPIDLSYHTLIPMMLAYGPESYAYQTWHVGWGKNLFPWQRSQGLPLIDKETRAAQSQGKNR